MMNALFILAQGSGGWPGLFTDLMPAQRFALLVIAIGCGVGLVLGLVGIVAHTVGSIHRRRAEMELKREMIERGMSADEIATIIESATPPEDATQRLIASWAKPKKA
jgi:hypothetical protein